MIQLNFKVNSWHHQISKFGGLNYMPNTDMCEYVKRFTFGILLMLLLIVIGSLTGALVIETVLGLAFSLFFGVWIMSAAGEILLITLAACVICVSTAGSYAFTRRSVDKVKNKDNFVANAYRGLKDKYCAKISFSE